MKSVLSAIAFALALLPFHVSAQTGFDFQDAIKAHKAKDYTETLRLIVPAAESGNADAQNLLCHMYRYGQGVAANITTAVSWCQKAADAGHKIGQFNMGVSYESGIGADMDHAKAFGYYCRSALNDYTPAKPKVLEVFSLCQTGDKDACTVIKKEPCAEEFYKRELSGEKQQKG